MAEYCEHDDDPNSCPPCRNAKAPLRAAPKLTSDTAAIGVVIDARFKSQCPRCRGLIEIDDRILMTQEDGWVHEDPCGDEGF